MQELDARTTRMKMQVMERNALIQAHRFKRMQHKLRGNLERNLAYKMVVDEHNFTKSTDYHTALNANYTYDALRPEVQRMMERLKPRYIREQKAKLQFQRSKEAQKVIIERNLLHPSLPVAGTWQKGQRKDQWKFGVKEIVLGQLQRERSNSLVPSSGAVMLKRWAKAFNLPKLPAIGADDVDGADGSVPLPVVPITTDEGATSVTKHTSGKVGEELLKKVSFTVQQLQEELPQIPSSQLKLKKTRKLKPIVASLGVNKSKRKDTKVVRPTA